MAQTGSGTVADWVDHLAADHWLATAEGPTTNNSTERYVVWDGPGPERMGVLASESTGTFWTGTGFDAQTPWDGSPTWDDRIWRNDNSDASGFSLSTSVDWWYETGADWFWSVVRFAEDDPDYVIAIAWQRIDEYWAYYDAVHASRVVTWLHSSEENRDRGWPDNNLRATGPVIDDGAFLENIEGRDGNLAAAQAATLGGGDELLQTDRSMIMAARNSNQRLVGEIDVCGIDVGDSEPAHLDSFDCGNSYQYIKPGNGLDTTHFFRIS